MKTNPFVTELLQGEWLLHNVESYYHILDAIRSRGSIDFQGRKDEFKSLEILDANGMALRAEKGTSVTIPENSIARVNMMGEIVAYSDWCAVGADEIVRQLYEAQSYQNVDATVMAFDTPGGSVKAIDMFREFAKYKTKPIVGLVKDALSLGYWAAVECCDYIMMDGNISSRVGSIGVVASFRDNTKMLEDAGIKIHEIYPPESNFKNKDFADAKEGKYEGIIKNSLSPLAQKFQASVKENRPNVVDDKSIGVLNGAVFFADKALELGLVDSIGDTRMAIQKAKELALSYAVNKSLF